MCVCACEKLIDFECHLFTLAKPHYKWREKKALEIHDQQQQTKHFFIALGYLVNSFLFFFSSSRLFVLSSFHLLRWTNKINVLTRLISFTSLSNSNNWICKIYGLFSGCLYFSFKSRLFFCLKHSTQSMVCMLRPVWRLKVNDVCSFGLCLTRVCVRVCVFVCMLLSGRVLHTHKRTRL